MRPIIGRLKELDTLRRAAEAESSEFIAVYGRRRIGKTFLIKQAFDNNFAFYLTGVVDTPVKQQLNNFHRALKKYDNNVGEIIPGNWFKAFEQLEESLSKNSSKKKIVFLDELPWLDTAKSDFLPALDYFWNSFASSRKDIVLIVCGSAASWMITKLIHNRGGLHNRITKRIRLEPFTLHETELLLKSKGGVFDKYQILQLYMVMGGIPFYLDFIDPSLSAAQNINKLCFQPDGLLVEEFDDLYKSLFNKAEKHLLIVEALNKKSKGLTRSELINQTGLSNAGSTTRILKELEESGFIRRYPGYGKTQRDVLYQLIDFYSLFYYKFIRDKNVLDEDVWINGLNTSAQKAWGGYAFELVCLTHIKQIKNALGISGIQTATSSWVGSDEKKGAQIDLVIDRSDRIINICEMKFSVDEFIINKAYAQQLKNKIAVFRESVKTNKAIRLTFISTFGVKRNEYAVSLIQNELTMEVLFLQI